MTYIGDKVLYDGYMATVVSIWIPDVVIQLDSGVVKKVNYAELTLIENVHGTPDLSESAKLKQIWYKNLSDN